MGKLAVLAEPKPIPKSKRKARLAVARDVIAALHASALTPEPGTYFLLTDKHDLDLLENSKHATQIHTLLKKAKRCDVCALGAMFTCHVARFDKITVGDFQDSDDSYFSQTLEKYFDTEQLAFVETAFEGTPSPAYNPADVAGHCRIGRNWMRAWPKPGDRMMAIMANILDNDGTFDPETIPTELPPPPKRKGKH